MHKYTQNNGLNAIEHVPTVTFMYLLILNNIYNKLLNISTEIIFLPALVFIVHKIMKNIDLLGTFE